MYLIIFLLLATVSMAYGQTLGLGPCPLSAPMSSIDLTKIEGRWYEYARSMNMVQSTGTCPTTTFNFFGNKLTFINKQFDSLLLGALNVMIGVATVDRTPGKYIAAYKKGFVPYTILDTDYSRYLVLESCTDFFIFNLRTFWILTRSRFADRTTVHDGYAALYSRSFYIPKLERTDQFWCPLFH